MKKYKVISVTNIDEIENSINNFIENHNEYNLKNIKVVNENKFIIIFEKYV